MTVGWGRDGVDAWGAGSNENKANSASSWAEHGKSNPIVSIWSSYGICVPDHVFTK